MTYNFYQNLTSLISLRNHIKRDTKISRRRMKLLYQQLKDIFTMVSVELPDNTGKSQEACMSHGSVLPLTEKDL